MERERKVHTAEEIRDEVARLLNEGRRRPLHVPMPLHTAFDPDPFTGAGCNWNMPKFRQVRGNEAAIGRAIMAVKAKWNLRD